MSAQSWPDPLNSLGRRRRRGKSAGRGARGAAHLCPLLGRGRRAGVRAPPPPPPLPRRPGRAGAPRGRTVGPAAAPPRAPAPRALSPSLRAGWGRGGSARLGSVFPRLRRDRGPAPSPAPPRPQGPSARPARPPGSDLAREGPVSRQRSGRAGRGRDGVRSDRRGEGLLEQSFWKLTGSPSSPPPPTLTGTQLCNNLLTHKRHPRDPKMGTHTPPQSRATQSCPQLASLTNH